MILTLPTKDEDNEYPVANEWRPIIAAIVKGIALDDYEILRGATLVSPPSAALADRIRKNIAAYGETVTDLSDDTWRRSVSRWRRTYWGLLIDLWTVESGRSDLALSVHVFESSDGFRFEIDDVHVPLA